MATEAHKDQVRKYTGEPYINHCVEVVDILKRHGWFREEHLAAAVLHDTVEDTTITFQDIGNEFGPTVRDLVFFLTNIVGPEQGNRQTRVDLNIRHIVGTNNGASLWIKCADLISNTQSIVKHDPGFARTYLKEKRQVLEAIYERNKTTIDPVFFAALDTLQNAEKELAA